jgi:GntR family transcriptional regulator / MocR family aminotransferase
MRTAITLDSTSTIPLHRQLYDAWRRGILSGRFCSGQRLPSSRELSTTLRIARSTVTQAYEQLLAEGYLESKHGSGTYVCKELPDEAMRPQSVAKNRARGMAPIKLSRFGQRLTEDYIYAPQPAGHICFSNWGPDLTQFPLSIWRKLLLRGLRKPLPAILNYAQQSQGLESLRAEIAAYVTRSRAVRCTPEQIVVLSGSQQALDFCARLLLECGDSVAFEDPGYLGTRRIFGAYGLKLRPAQVDAEGMNVQRLRGNIRLAYVTPSHQFPSGVAMSLRRRLELLAWARTQRAVIVEDDYDSEFRYTGPPLPALQGLAGDVPVVYCGTFSKVMFPSLRIGFVVLPTQLVAPFARAKWISDRHCPIPEQLALTEFLREGHLERHIRRMRKLYGERRRVLSESLHGEFGSDVTIHGDDAGMSLVARFADARIAERATRNRVQLISTRIFYAGKAPANEFIFGYSTLGTKAIREGIRRLR